jgi:exopolysaccharide biosynthesis polyprenyl glycosylphosphotransferase
MHRERIAIMRAAQDLVALIIGLALATVLTTEVDAIGTWLDVAMFGAVLTVLVLLSYLCGFYLGNRQSLAFRLARWGVLVLAAAAILLALRGAASSPPSTGILGLTMLLAFPGGLLIKSLPQVLRGGYGAHPAFASVNRDPEDLRRCIFVLVTDRGSDQEVARSGADEFPAILSSLAKVCGIVRLDLALGADEEGETDAGKIASEARRIDELVRGAGVTTLVIADREPSTFLTQTALILRYRGLEVITPEDLVCQETGMVPLPIREGESLAMGMFRGLNRRTLALKRALDIAMALVGLAILSPVMLVVALATRLESPGPVLYRQVRVGQGMRPFNILKFRSMRQDAESDGKARWAQRGDDRVTLVGRLLRRTRLDEVPQLINVLRGEMSLVGPRPERPEFVSMLARHIPGYQLRHLVRPGLTGWAQVNYTYGASIEDARQKLSYDLYYIGDRGVLFDLVIMARTLRVVVLGDSAVRPSGTANPQASGRPAPRRRVGRIADTPPLRVLEVNKFYTPHIGGMERMVQDLTKGLVRRHHRVRVLTCQSAPGPRRVARIDGAVVIYARSFGTFMSMPLSLDFLPLFWRLSHWADVVHWHEPFPLATVAALFGPGKAFRMVTWHSDIIRQRIVGPVCRLLQRAALRRADAVIPTSRRLAESSVVVDAASTRVHALPIGMPLEEITATDPSLEERWLSSARPFPRYALFVGRLVYYKGVDVLMHAAGMCDVPLVLVGHGPLADWIKAEIARLGMEGRVRLLDRTVDDDELRLLYKHADFLVLPSTAVTEAFGMVQVEVMAFGKPVINTSLPTGVPTVSVDGLTGLTVPVGDAPALAAAMAKLWWDAGLRHRFGEAARARAWSEFHSDGMVSGYLSIMAERARQAPTADALAPSLSLPEAP